MKKVESIKTRRKKRHNRDAVFINEPNLLDITALEKRFARPTDIKYSRSNPASPLPSSPVHSNVPLFDDFRKSFKHHNEPESHSNYLSPLPYNTKVRESPRKIIKKVRDSKSGDELDTSSHCSESSQESSSSVLTKSPKIYVKKPSRVKRFLQKSKVDEYETFSDSECHTVTSKKKPEKANSVVNLSVPKIVRGGSLNLGKESKGFREGFQRKGFRSRSTIRANKSKSSDDSDTVVLRTSSAKSNVNRWHSFQTTERRQSMCLVLPTAPPRRKSSITGIQLNTMSCGQIQVNFYKQVLIY